MDDEFVKQMFDYVNDSVGYHLGSADNLKGFMTFLAGMRSNITVANKVLAYGYNAYATDVEKFQNFYAGIARFVEALVQAAQEYVKAEQTASSIAAKRA